MQAPCQEPTPRYSRIKALEVEVRTIKALAMSEDEKQYLEHRNKLVEGVRRAQRKESAAQRVAVAKRRQLNIRTQNLQKFEDLVNSSSRPTQHAISMLAARCTDDSRYPSISCNIDSKHKEPQEPEADPQQSPTLNKQTKPSR